MSGVRALIRRPSRQLLLTVIVTAVMLAGVVFVVRNADRECPAAHGGRLLSLQAGQPCTSPVDSRGEGHEKTDER